MCMTCAELCIVLLEIAASSSDDSTTNPGVGELAD